MPTKRATSRFLIPLRVQPESRNHPCQPKYIKQWIAELPTANLGDCARQLYLKLKQTNTTELPVSERFAVLELLMEPISEVLSGLSERYAKEALPLSEGSKVTVELAQNLRAKLIVGYKVVLESMHNESLPSGLMHRSRRHISVYRVIRFLGDMLLCSYQLYRPYPTQIWKEVHGIYHYATSISVQHKQVQDKSSGSDENRETVENCYKRILLLALTGPYRLQNGEVEKIDKSLLQWSQLCRLRGASSSDLPDGLFLVDKFCDLPPLYRDRMDISSLFEGWSLDTQDLAAHLQDKIDQMEVQQAGPRALIRPKEDRYDLSVSMLRRLVMTWGIGVQRGDPRQRSDASVRLVFGIDSVYGLLQGEPLPVSGSGLGADPGLQVTVGFGDGLENELEDDLSLGLESETRLSSLSGIDAASSFAVAADTASWAVHNPEVSGARSEICKVNDESEGGYSLSFQRDGSVYPRVGDLVGIASARSNDALGGLSIGVIRWLRVGNRGKVDFGVQKLSDFAETAILKRKRMGRIGAEYMRALLLPSSGDRTDSLITTPFNAGSKDSVTLIRGDQECDITLEKVLEGNRAYVQFLVQDDLTQLPDSTAASTGDREETDFESIWDELDE